VVQVQDIREKEWLITNKYLLTKKSAAGREDAPGGG
jgi:hypothetical protein